MLRTWPLLSLLTLLASAPQARAEGLTITREQYKLYKEYQDALEDDRVKKMKPKDRMAAIARNFKIKEKELAAAVDLGEKEGAQVEATETAALKDAFKGTPLEGHLGELKVDARDKHIVTYVQWFNSEPGKLDMEACYAATRAAKAAPLSGTVFLTASDAAAHDKNLYTSLISADNANRIKEDQITDFAQTRYLGLFEKRQAPPKP